jgi:hypothetical protein
MAMKTVISYVSGTGGDFVVNCCNQAWNQAYTDTGSVVPTASIKHHERQLNDHDLVVTIDNMRFDYVGSHSVDRLLHLPVRALWLVIPVREQLWTWTARDCVTRKSHNLMGKHGAVYHQVQELVLTNQSQQAAEFYLSWLNDYNWTLMQMRIVQPDNKIDVRLLLQPGGIDSVIEQLPELHSTAEQCQQYHKLWLQRQHPLTNRDWVLDCVATKLKKLVQEP